MSLAAYGLSSVYLEILLAIQIAKCFEGGFRLLAT
jgi:hypothetical protein